MLTAAGVHAVLTQQTACVATLRSRRTAGPVRCGATVGQNEGGLDDHLHKHTATEGSTRRQDSSHVRPSHYNLQDNGAKETAPKRSRQLSQQTVKSSKASRKLDARNQASHHPASSSALSPQLLTSRIKQTAKLDELHQLVQQHGQRFNYINVAAAITRLGQWQRDRQLRPDHQQAVEQLLTVLEQLLLSSDHLQQCEPRQLSNVVWSCSLLGYNSPHLYSTCLQKFMEKLLLITDLHTVSSMLYGMAVAEQQVQPDQIMLMVEVAAQKEVLMRGAPQGITNILWSVAKLGQNIPEQQLQQMVRCLVNKLADAKPQEVSNTLWAIAAMRQSIPAQQLQQLVASLISKSAHAKPQNFSNTLWAVATMEQHIPEEQLQQLLAGLISMSADVEPQHASNTLWALAKMNASMRWQQVQRLEAILVKRVTEANALNIANAIWACGHLRYLPQQLLEVLQEKQLWQDLLPAMDSTCLAQVGWALGLLNCRDSQLMAAVLQQAVDRIEHQQVAGSIGCTLGQLTAQQLCNLCWSVAVQDMQQLISEVLALARSCAEEFGSCDMEGLQQLQQVHLWLQDVQQSHATGLTNVLSNEQLSRCRVAWVNHVQRAPSSFQKEVMKVVRNMPLEWSYPPAMEQLCDPDGMFSIDISGVTADGVRLAIEADGPTHFRRPDNKPTGNTLYRNRALAARGYVVVSVPVHEWQQQPETRHKQQYIMNLLQQQLKANGVLQLNRQTLRHAAAKAIAENGMQRRRRKQSQGQQADSQAQQQQVGEQQGKHQQVASVTATGRVRRSRRQQQPST